MAAARGQIEDILASLLATERQMRQEEIMDEIVELAAGENAARSLRKSRTHSAEPTRGSFGS
ncbi:hypothetical protein [Rhodoblastus sp.]|uniref:hypothetical protein n=1 Tax=Rhodoblastus sp. TaxID=1962975 RepID=UPI0026002823|nr:hypothetical protein [Rhodoblastus sp.]